MAVQQHVNPVTIARCFMETVQREFSTFSNTDQVSDAEQEIANLLFEEFGKLTLEYEFVEEFENDLEPCTFLSSSESQSVVESQGSSFNSQERKPEKRNYVTIKQKAKILKVIDEHPKWTFRTIKRKYPKFKDPNYRNKWSQQVRGGGAQWEMLKEINMYVFKRFQESRQDHKPVHDSDIQKWAVAKATEFPGFREKFTASRSWILKFKRKRRIRSRKITKLVKKRDNASQELLLKRAEDFRKVIRDLEPTYEPSQIWNTDQIGFQYEYMSQRTLSFKGEKYTFGSAFSPKNKLTHSYTVQYIINANGEIVGDVFVCLQEPSGRLGDRVMDDIFVAPNLCVTCSVSGKLTSTHVNYFIQKMIIPNLLERVLYTLDSWTGQKNEEVYYEALVDHDCDFTVKVIPPNTTALVQPLDCYFNLQLKYFVKKIYAYANVNDRILYTRNDILKIQSLAHFQLKAECFREMIKYSWYKSGLIENQRKYFRNVKDVCFNFSDKICQKCSDVPFIQCSWCGIVLCFPFFYDDFHMYECNASPYLK